MATGTIFGIIIGIGALFNVLTMIKISASNKDGAAA